MADPAMLQRISTAYAEWQKVEEMPVKGAAVSFEELLEQKLREGGSPGEAGKAVSSGGGSGMEPGPAPSNEAQPRIRKSTVLQRKSMSPPQRQASGAEDHRKLLFAYGAQSRSPSDGEEEDEPVQVRDERKDEVEADSAGEPVDFDLQISNDRQEPELSLRFQPQQPGSSAYRDLNSYSGHEEGPFENVEDMEQESGGVHYSRFASEDDAAGWVRESVQSSFMPTPERKSRLEARLNNKKHIEEQEMQEFEYMEDQLQGSESDIDHGDMYKQEDDFADDVDGSGAVRSVGPKKPQPSKLLDKYFPTTQEKRPASATMPQKSLKLNKGGSAAVGASQLKKESPHGLGQSSRLEELEQQLQSEIDRMKKSKENYERQTEKLQIERAELQRKSQEEEARISKLLESEKEKLKKERAVLEREKRSLGAQQGPNSAQVARENEELKNRITELDAELKTRDSKNKLTVDRLQRQISWQKEKITSLEAALAEKDAKFADSSEQWSKKEKDYKEKLRKFTQRPLSEAKKQEILQLNHPEPSAAGRRPAADVKGSLSTLPAADVQRQSGRKGGSSVASGAAHDGAVDELCRQHGAVASEKRGSSKTVYLFDDGHKHTVFSNGTTKDDFTDGRTCVHFHNGDTKTTYDDRVEYFFAETRTTNVSYSDGVEVYYFEGGQIEKHLPTGEKEIRFPDGTMKFVDAVGRTRVIPTSSRSASGTTRPPSALRTSDRGYHHSNHESTDGAEVYDDAVEVEFADYEADVVGADDYEYDEQFDAGGADEEYGDFDEDDDGDASGRHPAPRSKAHSSDTLNSGISRVALAHSQLMKRLT